MHTFMFLLIFLLALYLLLFLLLTNAFPSYCPLTEMNSIIPVVINCSNARVTTANPLMLSSCVASLHLLSFSTAADTTNEQKSFCPALCKDLHQPLKTSVKKRQDMISLSGKLAWDRRRPYNNDDERHEKCQVRPSKIDDEDREWCNNPLNPIGDVSLEPTNG